MTSRIITDYLGQLAPTDVAVIMGVNPTWNPDAGEKEPVPYDRRGTVSLLETGLGVQSNLAHIVQIDDLTRAQFRNMLDKKRLILSVGGKPALADTHNRPFGDPYKKPGVPFMAGLPPEFAFFEAHGGPQVVRRRGDVEYDKQTATPVPRYVLALLRSGKAFVTESDPTDGHITRDFCVYWGRPVSRAYLLTVAASNGSGIQMVSGLEQVLATLGQAERGIIGELPKGREFLAVASHDVSLGADGWEKYSDANVVHHEQL
jgi:hypothetical protein